MDYVKIRFVENPEGVESELFRTFEEMFRGANPRFTLSRHRWQPQIDVYETATEVIIQAEIAGVQREAINLEIGPRAVRISGNREICPHGEGARYRLAEISCGHFERTLSLPVLIDTEKAAAIYQNGLLEIRLAKRPLDRVQRISIQGS